MTEYTVHYQKGHRVGTRSLRLIHVNATSVVQARRKARIEAAAELLPEQGYRVVRVDHWDEDAQRLRRDF